MKSNTQTQSRRSILNHINIEGWNRKKKQSIKKICQSKIKNSNWKNEIQTLKKYIKGDEIIKKSILKSSQLKTISNQKNIDQIWDMKKIRGWNWK